MASRKKVQQPRGKGGDRKKGAPERSVSPYSPAGIRTFISQVQAEFAKIVWPDKKVTLGLTGFVLLLTFALSIYLGSVDLLLGRLVAAVLQ